MATEKRLLFKFYSSYFEIAQELNDKDRLAFYDALMKKQFTGIDTDLKGMANFAYISQKHSIDKQVEGWEFKMKTTLNQCITKPIEGGDAGGDAGGIKQEEVKEKEKEEVEQTIPTKSDIDFDALVKGINDKTKRKFHSINKSIQNKYLARLKEGYTKKHISTAIKNAVKEEYHINTNYKYLTPEFFSRSTTLDKYCDVSEIKEPVKQINNNVPLGPWSV